MIIIFASPLAIPNSLFETIFLPVAVVLFQFKVLKEALEKSCKRGAPPSTGMARCSSKSCSERLVSSHFSLHRSTLRYRPRFPCVRMQEWELAYHGGDRDRFVIPNQLGLQDRFPSRIRRGSHGIPRMEKQTFQIHQLAVYQRKGEGQTKVTISDDLNFTAY
jgi:hypothetical protein